VKNDVIVIATMMTVTLSCDHRVVDGALGAEFLSTLKGIIEEPLSLML
jgi:pyruvate dehydrogenase E2 component (dihydrolipoamide acetyltransferase)